MRKKYYRKEFRREFFNDMLVKHGDACMICHEHVRHLVIDHDHETGYMRGILCPAHNAGLGIFKDNPSLLRKAAEYLETTATKEKYYPEVAPQPKKLMLYDEALTEIILDQSYKTDTKRAETIASRFQMSYSAAQSRISRWRKKMEVDARFRAFDV